MKETDIANEINRFIPENGAVLELGASANSYLPDDLTLSQVAGVGLNAVRTFFHVTACA